ncbi:MAG: hypothetical protein LC623_09880 [Halobacteriales archaeon]|nr:hypothetical protein [Halobacteriales archaeon]
MDVDRLPRQLGKAVSAKRADPLLKGNIIGDDTWKAMLEVAEDHGAYSTSLRPMLDVNVLQHYRRTGWRNDEGCSPNLGDVRPVPQAPKHTYDVTLNATTGCYLKTGARTVPPRSTAASTTHSTSWGGGELVCFADTAPFLGGV